MSTKTNSEQGGALPQWEQNAGWQEIVGEGWSITLEPRPYYCDRGNFVAKVFGPDIDAQDGWPRYYFDEARAKAEIQAFVEKRRWR